MGDEFRLPRASGDRTRLPDRRRCKLARGAGRPPEKYDSEPDVDGMPGRSRDDLLDARRGKRRASSSSVVEYEAVAVLDSSTTLVFGGISMGGSADHAAADGDVDLLLTPTTGLAMLFWLGGRGVLPGVLDPGGLSASFAIFTCVAAVRDNGNDGEEAAARPVDESTSFGGTTKDIPLAATTAAAEESDMSRLSRWAPRPSNATFRSEPLLRRVFCCCRAVGMGLGPGM